MRYFNKGRQVAAAPVLAAMLLAASACGGKGGSTTPDGGADAPADTGAAGCDPALQDCAAGSKCDFGCQGTTAAVACRAGVDGGAAGTACSSSVPCARGTGCLTAPDAGSLCRKYCTTDPECATGERCHNVSVSIACGGTSAPLALHYCY
jgi:predicted small lipoprotein YifL